MPTVDFRKFLKLGDKPEAEFEITAEKIEAREYCNIHGLWKSSQHCFSTFNASDSFCALTKIHSDLTTSILTLTARKQK